MTSPFGRYARWLHTRWPAGTVENLPEIGPDGATGVAGVRIVGDLTGVPLLKCSADSGARAVSAILSEPDFASGRAGTGDVLDLAIVGAGVAGLAAALEAKRAGLRFAIFEAESPFSTIASFPRAKPIFTYPTDMRPAGSLQFRNEIHPKEQLLADLEDQLRSAGIEVTSGHVERVARRGALVALECRGAAPVLARRVIVAIGRSGDHHRLNVPGENLDKVFNRLYDPKDFFDRDVVVVGGGDSAVETAAALADAGARVTIIHRGADFARAKSDNVAMLSQVRRGFLTTRFASRVVRIEPTSVLVEDASGRTSSIANDAVFTMIGREPPLDFFRRSGIAIRGEWRASTYLSLALFLIFCTALLHFKTDRPHELPLQRVFAAHHWFPYDIPTLFDRVAKSSRREGNLLFTLRDSMAKPSFYYTLAYCACVAGFGIRRIRRRKTPYVRRQTAVLILVQFLPLFLLPEVILPWMGRNGFFSHGGASQWLADHLFERYDAIGHERAYWRAYGFILAFPLNVYNVFTEHPLWLWLAISFVQTAVVIPLLIWKYGKGAYCGWICSCGALAETMGDGSRQKMPHGPIWNRMNMVGQAVLAAAIALLGLRIFGWAAGTGSRPARLFDRLFSGIPFLNYSWSVDIFLGGILGVGLYFWFSGRVWCRFACPLAALMNIYTRFSRFRIFAEKDKCISCNLCTANCHQGIDVMGFANKGLPMEDPQCVRCSACVEVCPTGVLSFGALGAGGLPVLDRLPASPVQMREAPRFLSGISSSSTIPEP